MTVSGFVSSFRHHFPELVGQPVLVALSGGADSVALLHLMLHAQNELGCKVAAAHVNHHARAEAEEEERFCRKLCLRLGVALEVRHLTEVPPRGSSPEAWWRERRYEQLEAAREKLGCRATATAHTRDDQAETVLIKLLRGSGPRGVIGIRRRRGHLVRPLLEFGRQELRDWLRTLGEGWCEDPSNANLEQPRAWLRHVALPTLEKRFPGATRHLAGFGAALEEDDDALAAAASALPQPEIGLAVECAQLAASPPAVQRRWLLALAAELQLGEPPDRRQFEIFFGLLRHGTPAALDLGRRWVLRRRTDWLVLSPPPLAPFGPQPAKLRSSLALPGSFRVTLGLLPPPTERLVHTAWLSPQLAHAAVLWRSLQRGERVEWLGRRSTLGPRLARLGVPPEWRPAWPVLEADGRIVWVPGVGTAPGWAGENGFGIVATMEEPWKRHAR